MSTTTLDKALHVIERSAHFQARLHAQLAAFASEPNWPFTKLPLLTKSSDIEFLQQLAKDMNLGLNFEDSRIHVRRTSRSQQGRGAHKPLLDACHLYGARSLAVLLFEPLAVQGDGDVPDVRVMGARNASLLVRALAADGQIGRMLDALDEMMPSAGHGLLADKFSTNAAVASAMRALSRHGRPHDASDLFESSLASGMEASAYTLLQLCLAAKMIETEDQGAAARAIDYVAHAMERGEPITNHCIEAYLDCCVLVNAAEPAVAGFALGLENYVGEADTVTSTLPNDIVRDWVLPSGRYRDRSNSRINSLGAPQHDSQRRRLCSVLTACARCGDLQSAQFALQLAQTRGLRADLACANAWISVLGHSRPRQTIEARKVLFSLLRQGGSEPYEGCMLPDNGDRFWLPPVSAIRMAAAEQSRRAADSCTHALGPEDLRATLNIALATCGRQQGLVFSMLRDAASFGVVPDVVGLTSAVASTVDMKAEPYSEAHAAFLAESEALQAPEKNGATALVYWGLEIGIQPDQRFLEACSRALRPEAMQELLLGSHFVATAPSTFGNGIAKSSEGAPVLEKAQETPAGVTTSSDADTSEALGEAQRKLATRTKLAYLNLMRGVSTSDDRDAVDREVAARTQTSCRSSEVEVSPRSGSKLLARVESIAAKWGLKHRAAELMLAVANDLRQRTRPPKP